MGSARLGRGNQRPRNVLVLHSYHPTYEWTDELTRGIETALAALPFETELWIEYMDAKRTRPETRSEWTRDLLQREYRNMRLDLIITTDDDATAFALRSNEALPPGVPVVYCGVSNPEILRAVPRHRFTGVEESSQTEDFLRAAAALWKPARNVAVVVDNSATGRDLKALYLRVAQKMPGTRFIFFDGAEMTLPEIVRRVHSIPKDSLVVVSAFTRDRQGDFIPQSESGAMIAAAAPGATVSPNTSELGQGFLAGNANDGFAHGQAAGRMAARLLEGESPAAVPPVAHGNTRMVIDEAVARRLGIARGAYPRDAIVVNAAGGWRKFYAENRRLFWAALLAFVLQSAFTIALIVSMIRKRRAEAELRSSRASLERAQKIARLGSWERDVESGRLKWSKEVYSLFGLEPARFHPDTDALHTLIHPDDRQRVRELMRRSDAVRQSRTLEFRIQRSDGSIRHMRSLGEWATRPNGRGVVQGTIQDVTELREMEEHLRHAQRVESLGNLAGGIAHDFNNLLTIINGYSQILLKRMAAGDPHQGMIREIQRAGERAAALTRQLLAFSRKQVMEVRVLDLNEVIRSAEGLLRPLLGEGIEYRTNLQPGLHPIEADSYQLEQVLLNLAANARDAMPSGGVLTIETRNEDLASFTSWQDIEIEPGPYVRLLVSDNGQGMEESVRQRVFDPFFTTKPLGKGTGLGLSSAFGIIRQSGGYLSLSSAPGAGATFHILLPAVSGQVEPVGAEEKELAAGAGRILIVEDEEQIRRLAAATLSELGYQVACAAEGAEALRMGPETLGGAPDLLIADIVMPGMSGIDLSRQLRERHPELQVLLISGYAGRGFEPESAADASFLAKPFLPAELAERVRALLGDAPRG